MASLNQGMLQCGAVCCSGVQFVAVCCNMLQCVAVCCNLEFEGPWQLESGSYLPQMSLQ